MPIDTTKPMNAKDRRIWRRRRDKRFHHTVRCAMKYGKSCNCNAGDHIKHGTMQNADKIQTSD